MGIIRAEYVQAHLFAIARTRWRSLISNSYFSKQNGYFGYFSMIGQGAQDAFDVPERAK